MAFKWCLLICFPGLILGFALDQEAASTIKPIILDDPPLITLDPNGDPPMISPPRETTDVPVLRKEDVGGFENINPTHVNGEELFESDILLSPEQRRQFLERKAIATLSSRWPNGPKGTPVVPYQYGDTAVNTTAIEAALAHWEEHTCIDFQLISGTAPSNYLNFTKGSGCWSYVGMLTTPQDISIGDGCNGLGTIAHEVGHAIGFFHEQSRSDRDDYVSIIFENIQAGKEGNFQKNVDNNYSVKYDFTSDLHYGSDYFSVNGKDTITTKNPLAQGLIGQRTGLSHYDKLLANTMYPCIAKWMQNCSISTNPCQNDGYVGKNCTCVCRSGTSGANCQTVNQGYYDSLVTSCTANITAPGTITSPNYPNNYPANSRCVKWIQAPECTTVTIKFNSFRLYGRNPYCGVNNCCYFDALEIRTTNLTVGDVYCDQDIAAGTVFTSPSNQMILFFRTTSSNYPGWSANVTFVPVPSCQPTTTSTSTSTSTTTSTSTPTTTSTTTSTSTTTTKPTTTSTTTTTSTPTTTSTTTSTSTTTTKPTTTSTTTTTSTPTTTSTTTSTSTTTTKPTTTSTTTSTSTTTTKPTTTSTTTSTSTTTTKPTTTSTTTSTSTTTTKPTTTSTSTTTTKPTTTSTSTTTTKPTTTSTTTSTSTTTTKPTTTSTTITTTTAGPSPDKCNIVQLTASSLQWTSPNFGLGNYPNNKSCSLSLSSTSPAWLELKLNKFSLHSSDQVSFLRPANTTLILTNNQTGVMNLPSVNTVGSFYNSATNNGIGFNITITGKSSNCHQLINATAVGANGTIAAPALPNYTWQRKACEFWIRSPTGSKVLLTFTNMTLSTTCSANSVVVNKDGNSTYPTATSSTFCGTTLPSPIKSTANAMNVLFFSTTDNPVFGAKWSVVAS